MPRLDGGDSSSGHPASAYPRQPLINPLRVVFYFFMFMTLRNVMTKNYRNEEISYLKSSGVSDAEIDKFVPKTQFERDALRKKSTVHELQLLREVELLKQQVKELQMHVFNTTAAVESKESSSNVSEKVKPVELTEDKELKEEKAKS
eukprot:scaffold278261_cov103-Cyclotella_meneghiniana.AAC.3